MKVLFICGSLEYGRDGVGDYTRQLALELLRKGHETQVFAIHDKKVQQTAEEIQKHTNKELKLVRIPRHYATKTKCEIVLQSIQQFNPQFISLQFVHFAFHEKGLPFFLRGLMSRVVQDRNSHIMFHELWVGMEKNTSLKIKLWRTLQQIILHSLVIRMNPAVIHTQTTLYKKQLQKKYRNAKLLPLFANIRMKNNLPADNGNAVEKNKMIFVVFGSIHPMAPIKEFASELKMVAVELKKMPVVWFIGHNGKLLTNWLSELGSEGIETEVLGTKDEHEISEVLSTASFGLSSTPLYVIEKSGTVAAMRQHGLKVICVAREWVPTLEIELELPRGIYKYTAGCLKGILSDKINVNPGHTLSEVADQLILDLETSLA